jgi:hypothetical protein
MKLRLMCVFVAVVLASNLAFADILWWGITWPRWDNASVDGDWDWAGITIHVNGTAHRGWGQFAGLERVYTTEAGNFQWGCDFRTHAKASFTSQYTATAWAYGEAWATGPASDNRTLYAATSSVGDSGTGSYSGEDGPYNSSPGRPSTYFAANEGVETLAGVEGFAEVADYSADVAYCYGFAMAEGWMQP